MTNKKYLIGKKYYEQRALVYGQVRQLQEILEGLRLQSNFDQAQMLAVIGDRIPLALAVVLIPEGGSPRGKDLPALADEIEFDISLEQVFEVLDDFFTCNPIASLLTKLKGMTDSIKEKVSTGLTKPSASSPEETLPGKDKSSGDAHQGKQSLT